MLVKGAGIDHVIVRYQHRSWTGPPTALSLAGGTNAASLHHDVQTMDLHASQIQGFFDIPVDKYVIPSFARPMPARPHARGKFKTKRR